MKIPCFNFHYIIEKRTYNGLPDFLTKVARDELDKLSNDITECNIRYLPQVWHNMYYYNKNILLIRFGINYPQMSVRYGNIP